MTWLAPVAVAGLVMLPRLASPQFGLLDDGLILKTGREVAGHWSSALYLIPETGRFFPAYWLARSAIVGVVGVRPLASFTVNVAILAALLAILAGLVRSSGGSRRQAAVAIVVFATCGPAIESFYTLSKAEPLQLLWIGLSLIATVAATRREARSARRAGLIALGAGALLLAHATKETSVVLVPISLGWLAVEWRAGHAPGPARRFAATYATISAVTTVAFLALRSGYAPLALGEGTYTRAYTLDSQVVGPSLFRIAAWLLRDFPFLLPLLAFAVAGWLAGRPWSRPMRYAGVWMLGWLAVFLPWPATFEYYLLPFALGAAALAAMVGGECWAARGPSHPVASRRMAWSVLATSGLLWLVAVVNAAADARVQLTVDSVNTRLVDFLAGLPGRSRVVLNTATNEYHAELPRHLSEIKRRPDLVVEDVSGRSRAGRASADAFVVTAELANRPWPTVRVALDETGVGRDHAMLGRLLAGPADPVYRAAQQARIVEVGLHRLLCPVTRSPFIDPTFCPSDRGVLDSRLFSYGWQVHRLTRHDG